MYIAIWNDGRDPGVGVKVAEGDTPEAVKSKCKEEASHGEVGTYYIYDAKLVETARVGELNWLKEMPF